MGLRGLASFLPILGWMRDYRRDWIGADLLAGLALWAVMVPEGMAYAGIVGVPPIMGLYTIVPPLLAYALFGTSRRLVVGPDTATGVISALTIAEFVARNSAQFFALTSTLAVVIGLLFLLFGLLRTGWIAAFVATPVMRGFIEGLVGVTIIGQVASMLGLHGAGGNFVSKLLFIRDNMAGISGPAALTGLASLAALLLLRRFAPRLPAALIVAAGATLFMTLFPVPRVGLVGELPSGLPQLELPISDTNILMQLLPGALSIVLVGYAETLAAAHGAVTDERIDPNQELIANGFANAASGLFGGFLVVGSLSKTSVSMSAGSQTQVANLVSGVLTIATLLFLTPLFRNLPHPTLAAIVIAAMLHLSKPAYLRRLAQTAPQEFAMALVVIAGELMIGVLQGIALGVVLSLLSLIYLASHPHSTVLGKLPNEDAYRDVALHAEAQTFPGLLIFNPGGSLFFANADRFETDLKAAIARNREPVRHILFDGSSITFIDSSAIDMLARLITELRGQDITVAFARLRDPIVATLNRRGIVAALGRSAFHDRLTDGARPYFTTRADRDEAQPG